MKKYILVTIAVVLFGVVVWLQVGKTAPGGVPSPASDKSDLIRVTSPKPNDTIVSPLTIKGEARGTWFFEASFPVVLVNWDGLIIGQGIAKANADWMTEKFVPFTATIEFVTPTTIVGVKNSGSLILKKDNPSGLPANDNYLEIPIIFEENE